MPGGDRTGPYGAGPMTGRRAGFCAGYDVPGAVNPAFGRGMGFGRGIGHGGRGWRNIYYATGLPRWSRPYYPTPTPEQELAYLKEESNLLKNQLDTLNKRIEELSKE